MRILLVTFVILLNSCFLFKNGEQQQTVARVGDAYLLLEDLQGVVPVGASSEDSTLIVNNYIDNWIKENLILSKAELNLKEQQKDFEKQLEDYRLSLINYSYEKELIRQKLDTHVANEEILDFYENNKEIFELKNDIVKVRYLKVNKKAPQLKKIRKIYASEKLEELASLKTYAHQYAEKFHFSDEQWIFLETLTKEIPIISSNQKKGFLKGIKYTVLQDELFFYFIYVKDVRQKKELSPLSFERENIKSILLNKRKLALIKKIKEDLYLDAIAKKEAEIYDVNE